MRWDRLALGCIGLWQGVKTLAEAFEEHDRELAQVDRRRLPRPGTNTTRYKVKTYTVPPLKDRKSAEARMKILIPLIQKGRRDPKIRAFTVRLLSQKCGKTWCVPERDWRKEVEVIFRALRQRYRYVHDPVGIDHFSSARKTLALGGEDCDGAVILLASHLGSVGYETRAVIVEVEYPNGETGWHIYLEAKIPDRRGGDYWLPLDLTVDRPPGWEPPRSMIKQRFVFPIP